MQKTLLLIDGSNYLYRAFYALPNMRNIIGEPTGALYGMINMLSKVRNNYPANFIACIFDTPGKTFRDTLYPQYKATRKLMPQDLISQLAPIYATVRGFGWPILMIKGIEADDVIGTLSVQAKKIGLKSIIFTGDKDLAQLVNENVIIINTMNNEVLDRYGVIAKFGVPPEYIVDYLSLIGDTIDNIPGVKKCGPKTARKWLTQYGSLDGIIANADKIAGIVGINLRKTLQWLPKARILLTIKTDCNISDEITTDIRSLLTKQPQDKDSLRQIFIRYNFYKLLNELNKKTKFHYL